MINGSEHEVPSSINGSEHEVPSSHDPSPSDVERACTNARPCSSTAARTCGSPARAVKSSHRVAVGVAGGRALRFLSRALVLCIVASSSAVSILALAQPKKPAVVAPAKKPPARPPAGGAGGGTRPLTPDPDDAGALASKEERPSPARGPAARDAGANAVVESKTLDGGTRVFRFGEVEVEGRLRSPQIVYFLRRVRAEFSAADLGHRSFMRELSETRTEPEF